MNASMKILAAALALALTAPAFGQNALGDGTALDANPQQGSGGYNQPQRIGGPIDANRIITGNVTGSSFFRGEVPYRAVGEFTDVTGDEELFRFRAITQPGTIPAITSRTFGERLAPTPYFRDISGVTAGDIRLGQRVPAAVSRSWAAQDQLYDTGIITASPGAAIRSFTGGTLGLFDETGRFEEITASPLFGVVRRPIGAAMFSRPELDLPQAAATLEPLAEEAPSGLIEPTRWGAQPEEVDATAAAALGYTPALLSRGVELGLHFQPWSAPAIGEAPSAQLEQRMQKIESSIFSPLERPEIAPGDDVYVDLLRMMRAGRPEEALGAPRTEIELEKPSDQQMRLAGQMRRQAVEELLRLQREGETTAAGELPQAVEQLVQTLGQELPTVATLAGSREDLANQHMREAERALADGRYFDAERRYERVLQLKSNYPLARVGLMHAQLGAGLVRSAALNLRNIFAAHPELIVVRYDAKLLPSPDRLRWVRGELDGIIERGEHQYPAVLLAYLGYQTSNEELVQYGLDMAQARDPSDPLIPLLRRLWLHEQAPGAAQEPEPQNQAPAAPEAPQPVNPGDMSE